ncbi:MAG: prenyltransferase/squalene oxidase repeat-containing protein [Pirellulales bacterium]
MYSSNRMQWISVAVVLAALAVNSNAFAKDAEPANGTEAQRQAAVAKGLEFLRTQGQGEDGLFTGKAGPGVTALALTGALRNGVSIDDPMVAKGLKALEGFVKPDGGIYGDRLKNYETCVSIVAFKLANTDGRYDKILADADKYVRGLQYGPARDKDPNDPWYGGAGYGGDGRPDLSNTSYLIDALVAGGSEADDEAIQRALVFVSRCQNLKGQWNDTKFGPLVNDGGFYYTLPGEKEETTGPRFTADGGLRSYGSMTYAGYKSLVYAGLTESDPRVKAALDWISKFYTVDDNPGQGDAGIYYYYNAFAAALNASKLSEIKAADGQSHDWRADLIAEIAERQQDDGSWQNSNRQWMEGDKNLSTAFALIALAHAQQLPAQP